MKATDWIYNSLIHLVLPVVAAGTYWSFRGRSPEKHTSLKFTVPSSKLLDNPTRLWVHCASVGEAGLANQLLSWRTEFGLESDEILVTTQTLSGLNRVDHNRKVLLPADYPTLIGPMVDRVDAECLVVIETEIWPNLYRLHPNKLALLNGRISDDSYESYRFVRPFLRVALSHCDVICTRSEGDRSRFEELSPDAVPIKVGGNMKWTRSLNPPDDEISIRFSNNRPIVVAGSTHPGEERIILESLKERNVNLILAPRHLNRLKEVKGIFSDFSWYSWIQSSQLGEGLRVPKEKNLLLIDEYGRLESSYSRADLAFIGGSLDTTGGHNLMEAAQFGVPVITGPNLDNFRPSAEMLDAIGLLTIARDDDELMRLLGKWEFNPSSSKRSEQVTKLHEKIRPIKDTYVNVISELLDG